ncbi:MAG: nucleotidyltransferase family protein [Thermoanaerobaculia bacterium]|nr:nucleotidyltransferase family protein [Thermoanaerobaculia bacterium]
MNVCAIVLSAGLSSRMGAQNKLFLPFGKHTVLETTLARIEAAGIAEILVVTGYEQERVRGLFQNKPYRLVENPAFRQGMSSSIKAGVAAARPDAAGFMICLADMPLISGEEYRLLAEALISALETDPMAIVQPRFQEQAGNPVLFSARYRSALLTLEYPEGARPIVQANREHIVPVNMPTDAVLLDADTPEAYQILLERLKE